MTDIYIYVCDTVNKYGKSLINRLPTFLFYFKYTLCLLILNCGHYMYKRVPSNHQYSTM